MSLVEATNSTVEDALRRLKKSLVFIDDVSAEVIHWQGQRETINKLS